MKIWRYSFFAQRENIAMFHHGRCGSTALAHLLQKHPDISWAGEIIEHETDHENAFRKISGFIKNNPSKHCGIEIKPFHLSNCQIQPQEFLSFLKKEDYTHFILLTRKNILRSIISSQISSKTNIWHINDAAGQKLNRIHLELDNKIVRGKSFDILSLIQMYEEDIREFEALLSDTHLLRLTCEEDVLPSPDFGYKKICDFLKVPYIKSEISLVRTNPFPISDMVINHAELADRLHNTPYEWMLKE